MSAHAWTCNLLWCAICLVSSKIVVLVSNSVREAQNSTCKEETHDLEEIIITCIVCCPAPSNDRLDVVLLTS